MPDRLITPRLQLIPATIATCRAELESRTALGNVLNVEVPESWPPDLYDEAAIRWTMAMLEAHPDSAGWGLYYIAQVRHGRAPVLVGTAGYKGVPDDQGQVEIGYGVLADRRREGMATEAARGLVAHAFTDLRVSVVIAHTLENLLASITVLKKVGFCLVGPGSDPEEADALRYELSRAKWEVHVT